MKTAEELKTIVANNISNYRKAMGLTQAELAEKMNYSDKSISKWERGEGFPDIFILKNLADFFGIQVDDFFEEKPVVKKQRKSIKKEILIPLLSVGIAWLSIATLFAIAEIFLRAYIQNAWLFFVYGVPISGIILTVFSAIYRKRIALLISESIIVWGVGASIFLTTIAFRGDTQGIWLVFIICAVLEVLAFLYFLLKNDKINFRAIFKKKEKKE